MAEANGELTVAERLGRLLDRGILPAGGPAEAAERLIERLERPARVALLGLPGAGKSAILNLLAGATLIPEALRLPSIIVQHGPASRMLCTLANGRVEDVPGVDLEEALRLNPALVTVEMDLPALKVISLLEVSAGPLEADQRRAALWASKRADILIWCSTSYLPKEQVVWESMPDPVKDNGFLFVTKVDLLGSRSATTELIDRIEQRAGEDFRQVLPISVLQARAAMAPGQAIDRDKFRDSGAAAVITTIKTRVQMARRADLDMAELLLARHVEASNLVAQRFAAPASVLEPAPAPAAVPMPDPIQPEAARSWTLPPEWAPPPEPTPTLKQSAPEEAPEAEAVAEAAESVEPVTPPEAEVEPAAEDEAPAEPAMTEDNSAPLSEEEPEPEARPDPVRLSERLRQAPSPEDLAATPAVPLRSTWKSRAEMAEAAETQAKPAAAGFELDDNAIAAMLAAVAAAPAPAPSEPKVATPRAPEPVAERPPRPSVFSARRPEPAAPPPATPTLQPRPRIAAEPAAPPQQPPAPAQRPRVAVLHEHRPEPAATARIDRRERPRISARVIPVQTATAAALPVPLGEKALLTAGITLLADRAADLLQQIDPEAKLPVDLILDHARETTEQTIEALSSATSRDLRRINSDLGEVQDLIMLMQLEKGHAPADDALTLLLQIKRDLETLLAS